MELEPEWYHSPIYDSFSLRRYRVLTIKARFFGEIFSKLHYSNLSCIISWKWRICEEYLTIKTHRRQIYAAMECESVEISGFLQVRVELWSLWKNSPQKRALIVRTLYLCTEEALKIFCPRNGPWYPGRHCSIIRKCKATRATFDRDVILAITQLIINQFHWPWWNPRMKLNMLSCDHVHWLFLISC